MRRQMGRWVCVCALGVLAGSGGRLEARPWKKAVTAAMVLAFLGSGPGWALADAAVVPAQPDDGRPFADQPASALPAAPDGPWEAAGTPGPDPLDAALGACEDACGAQLNLGTIRCEVYQRMPALRTLCLTQVLAADEACMRGCEGR